MLSAKGDHGCGWEFLCDYLGGEVGPSRAAIEYDTVTANYNQVGFRKFKIRT